MKLRVSFYRDLLKFVGIFGVAVAGVVFATWSIIRASAATTNATRSVAMDEYGRHFEIMYYWGPSGEQINANNTVAANIANAGFTIAPVRGSWSSQWTYGSLPSAIEKLDSYNLKALVFEGSNTDIAVAENPTAFYNANIKPYTDFKNVVGYDITDEPAYNSISGVSVGLDLVNAAVPRLYALDPMRDSYVNMFPNYAPTNCLQYKTASGCDGQGSIDLSAYEDYLAAYYNNGAVRTMSVDYYPKAKNNLADTYSGYSDRDLYYTNLRSLLYHYKAKKNLNIETVPMNIVSLHDWYVDSNSASQIRYQVSTNLAFGMKAMSYFTYMKPVGATWSYGWMYEDGGVTSVPLATTVANVNDWAFNLGNELYMKEVGVIDQVYGTNMARVYRDDNVVDNNAYLGAITASTQSGGAAQAIVTAFDDASFYIANGEPNQQITVTWTGGVSLSESAVFNANTGVWSGCYAPLCAVGSGNSVTLPAGGNILFHLGAGISNNTGVMIDRENKKVVLYSGQLSDVTNDITSSVKQLSGTSLTLADGTYDIYYPQSENCKIRPAYVWTTMNGNFAGCNVTTNSTALKVGQVDDDYMYVKYQNNGGQVKNIPIISGTVTDYTVSGDTIKTNGEAFDISKIAVTNGIVEQEGSSLYVYTWPKKILVAKYSIDTSAPVVDHAYFTNITLSSGTLSPAFNAETVTYAVSVPYDIESMTVTGVGDATYGVANDAQTKNLTAGGVTAFILTATDANNYSRIYTVNVTRAAPPTDYAFFEDIRIMFGDTDLSDLISYDPETTTYSISVPYEVDRLAVYGIGNGHTQSAASERASLTPGAVSDFVLVANDGNYSRTYTIYVTRANPPEDHAYFTDITLSSGVLSPNFDAGTTTYAVSVPYDIESMTVTGVGDATYGVANDAQTKNLTAGGVTTFILTAVDANDFSRAYTVNVMRAAPPVDHAYFTSVSLSAGTISFMPETTTYSISVPYSADTITILAVGNATYGVADRSATRDLAAGGTTTIVLTAIDENNYSRDYTFYVTRASAPIDHAYFTNIILSNGSLSPNFDAGTTEYNVRVANAVGSLTVTGVGNAAYGISDVVLTKGLTAGAVTTFTLTARDENEFSRDYVVKVYREADATPTVDHAYFTNITLSSGTLSPAFNAETTEYTVSVPYTVNTMTVTGVGNAAYGVADVVKSEVELAAGRATRVVLEAEDENHYTREYVVEITRAVAGSNANLASLVVTYELDGEKETGRLSPTFSPTIYTYAATVPYEAENISYTYVLGDANATAVGGVIGPVTVLGTTVEIKVVAQDGSTKQTYELTITREAPETVEMTAVANSMRTDKKRVTVGTVTVVDTVKMKNLRRGEDYVLKGTLMDVDGNGITLKSGAAYREESFAVPNGGARELSVSMELEFNSAKYAGQRVVVFLELYDGEGEIVASLKELESEAQAVRVLRAEVGSKLVRADNGGEGVLTEETILRDRVTWKNLTPGNIYRFEGELWRVDEGGVKIEKVMTKARDFTASAENNDVGETVDFELDGVVACTEAGEVVLPCRLAVFGKLYYGEEVIAEEAAVNEGNVAVFTEELPSPDEPGGDNGESSGSDSGVVVPKAPNTGRGGLWREFAISLLVFYGLGGLLLLAWRGRGRRRRR